MNRLWGMKKGGDEREGGNVETLMGGGETTSGADTHEDEIFYPYRIPDTMHTIRQDRSWHRSWWRRQ